MAITPHHFSFEQRSRKRGFALLIAIVFTSVMLTFGIALASIAYKQEVLASGAIASQYAFYVADAALECALYADQQQNLFAYTSNLTAPAPAMTCSNVAPVSASVLSHTVTRWVIATRLSLDSGSHCADVTVYKNEPTTGTTYIYSQGYNAPCSVVSSPAGQKLVSRGLNAHY